MKLVRNKLALVVCSKDLTLDNVKSTASELSTLDWDLPIISLSKSDGSLDADITLVGSEHGTQIYRPNTADNILMYAVDATREDLSAHLSGLIRIESTQKAVMVLYTASDNSASILRVATSALFSHLPTYRQNPPIKQQEHHYNKWREKKQSLARFKGKHFKPSFITDIVISKGTLSPSHDSFATPIGDVKLNTAQCSWQGNKLQLTPVGNSPATFGPYAHLTPGVYEVVFGLELSEDFIASEIIVDVVAESGASNIAGSQFTFGRSDAQSRQSLSVIFEIEWAVKDLETRLWLSSGDSVIFNRYVLRKIT